MAEVEEVGPMPTRIARIGYATVVLVDLAGLVVLYLWPGWEQIPVLTEDTRSVLGVVDLALVVGIVVNLLQPVRSPGSPSEVGSLVTTVVGLAAMVRVAQVFPFDLTGGWASLVRAELVFGIAGAAVGVLAILVSLVRVRWVAER